MPSRSPPVAPANEGRSACSRGSCAATSDSACGPRAKRSSLRAGRSSHHGSRCGRRTRSARLAPPSAPIPARSSAIASRPTSRGDEARSNARARSAPGLPLHRPADSAPALPRRTRLQQPVRGSFRAAAAQSLRPRSGFRGSTTRDRSGGSPDRTPARRRARGCGFECARASPRAPIVSQAQRQPGSRATGRRKARQAFRRSSAAVVAMPLPFAGEVRFERARPVPLLSLARK